MRFILCLLLAANAACAATGPVRQRHFDAAYRDAEVYARNGRTEECRASLLALRAPLLEMTSAEQGRRAARLVRALTVVGEVESARALRHALLEQRKEEARIAADQARRRDPEVEARGLFASARGLHVDPAMRRSLLANVRALLEKVAAPAPDSLLARGVARQDAGDLAAARADIEAAAKLLPNSVQPTFALARLARAEGDLKTAETLVRSGLAQEATGEGLQLLALELADRKTAGQAGAAEKRAREWIDRAKGAEGVELLLAFVAKLDEERNLLEPAFEQYLRASAAWPAGPSTADAVRLGRKLAARGEAGRRSVLKLLEENAPPDPGTPADLLLLAGDLHGEDKNTARAIAYYEAGERSSEGARFAALLEPLRPKPSPTAPPPAQVTSAPPDPSASAAPELAPSPAASPAAGPTALVLRLDAVRRGGRR